MTHAHTTSQALKAQIDRMVERNEDYVIDADGVDESNMHRYTRVQRLA
jgi:hypothetical protein